MPAKRKASSTDLQEPRRPRGRPPKPDKAKAKASLAKAKAPLSKAKAPPSKPKTPSASTSASDNSEVLTLSTESSRRSLSPLTDSDVQDATEALLGLAGGLAGQRSTNNKTNDVSDGEDDGSAKRVEEDEDEEDDLDTDNDEETPEEEPITSVELLVPVDGASDPWELEFSMDWDDFLEAMADMTGIRVRDLKLGYKLSTAGTKETLRVLEKKKHLERLVRDAKKELERRRKLKTPPTKDFNVLINHRNLDEKKTKGTEKKTSKESAKKKGKSRKRDQSDEDDDDDDGEGSKKKSGADYLRELEAARACEKHGGHCVVAENGEHVSLSTQNLSLWSLLMAQGVHDSLVQAPAHLGLNIQTGSKAPPASRRKQDPSPMPFPYPYPPYTPYPFYPTAGHGPYPGAAYPPPPPPQAPVPSPPASTKSKFRKTPSVESYDDPTIYPKISEWLLELDTSPRGEDSDHFLQYADAFASHGFKRIVELQDKTEDALRLICTGMSMGVSGKLVKYVQADCRKARKRHEEMLAEFRS
ncbi:hypothetical protein B0H12DRAFT_1136011 [Mycena haematopus]|nr:hypothetical protein B0H12DRAFT_1136011 [Mycena haematopus]